MSPPSEGIKMETKAEAEALIPLFRFEKILNQDQNGRRITLLGTIRDLPAVFSLERAAFPSDPTTISSFLSTLANTTNLGTNDVYRWYMSNHLPSSSSSSSLIITTQPSIHDLKLNLIYPCTQAHIQKYTSQPLRYVTETPEIYKLYIKPWIERTQRTPKRLDWIYNILDGITEQEDVIYRSSDYTSSSHTAGTTTTINSNNSAGNKPTGFLLLPDLNWDRHTLTSLHLLALPQRRDLCSLRSLRRSDVSWLRSMLSQIKTAAAQRGTELAARSNSDSDSDSESNLRSTVEVMEPDQVKCYVHYQPTYYHFHVHVVHVMLEPEGGTQSVGKAIGLESLIVLLEGLRGEDPGLEDVDITYHIGEASELWTKCFAKVKLGEKVDLLDGL